MNLKLNKHKRISFNTTTMASLGFIAPPPPPNLIFCSGPPPQLFWPEIFRSPLKLGGCYHDESKYSRMDQVKFVKDSLQKI